MQALRLQLTAIQQRNIDRKQQNFIKLTAKMDAMSPLKVLTRGYAIAEKTDGTVIKSVNDINRGESFHVRLKDGSIAAEVSAKEENHHEQQE